MTDVCLILEGTYPYIPGGVSSCVFQMIKGTPQINYGIVFIGTRKSDYTKYHFDIPSNVDYVQEIFLYDDIDEGEANDDVINIDELISLQKALTEGKAFDFEPFLNGLINNKSDLEVFSLLKNKTAWEKISEIYKQNYEEDEIPFIDYFYNWRYTLLPILRILSTQIPEAKMYHSLSTGYAGLFGLISKVSTKKPFLITEHGIYSHEREIEISKADWLLNTQTGVRVTHNLSYFKDLWINMFHFLSKSAYEYADRITTLYNGNVQKQIRFGADPEKLQIIPNGIKYDIFSKLEKVDNGETTVIGLVGRVVPIKDIKTFIKAISIVNSKCKNIDVMIMGPYEEDPEYYMECARMTKMLGLENLITYTGMVNLKNYYPKLDIMVLSSISEGQPVVMLEAFTLGIPCVTTDVGSCSELIHGMSDEDKAIGSAGAVVPFGRPDLLASEIIKIVEDKNIMKDMGESAKIRVKKYYKEEHYLNNYLNLYNEFGQHH
jgi:glycosyltransferase involved in cell wall biosynthesis